MTQLAPNIDSFHQSARPLGTRFGTPKNDSGITVSKNRNSISQMRANDFRSLYVVPLESPKPQPLHFTQSIRIISSNLKHLRFLVTPVVDGFRNLLICFNRTTIRLSVVVKGCPITENQKLMAVLRNWYSAFQNPKAVPLQMIYFLIRFNNPLSIDDYAGTLS